MACKGQKPDPHEVARVVADAELFGVRTSAKYHKISEKTVLRYKTKVADDPRLSELVQKNKHITSADLRHERRMAIKAGLRRFVELLDEMSPRELIGGLKILGESEVIAGALDDEQPGRVQPNPTSPTPGGRDSGDAQETDPKPISLIRRAKSA